MIASPSRHDLAELLRLGTQVERAFVFLGLDAVAYPMVVSAAGRDVPVLWDASHFLVALPSGAWEPLFSPRALPWHLLTMAAVLEHLPELAAQGMTLAAARLAAIVPAQDAARAWLTTWSQTVTSRVS